ncbi:receptor-like protein kinase FERONIA, partial [Tanacetum coccineum]
LGLASLGVITSLVSQHMYSLSAYAFIARDFSTQAALYTHHQYIAGFIMTEAFAHGAILGLIENVIAIGGKSTGMQSFHVSLNLSVEPDKYDLRHYDSSVDLLKNQFEHLEKLNSGYCCYSSRPPQRQQSSFEQLAMSVATGYGNEPEASTSSSIQLSQQCRRFELSDIMLATKNFDKSSVIGRGGFGKVYIGTIFNGSATVLAAVKRLDTNSNQGAPEFWAEVEMLSKLRHCNLVSLFGYCNEEKEMILVYEYMPNGTLEDHLHKLGTPLSWVQRLKICIDAGRGLHYLHTGTGIDVGVIHRDVKTSNILLHETWAAKISDFGLS